jgi:hypothetical protein
MNEMFELNFLKDCVSWKKIKNKLPSVKILNGCSIQDGSENILFLFELSKMTILQKKKLA